MAAGYSTSTQKPDDLLAPLSPINISLSQLCALDCSLTDDVLPGATKLSAEDSGYHSKNQIEATSPGVPLTPGQGSKSDITATAFDSTIGQVDLTFAETAKESLNDSLEEENDIETVGNKPTAGNNQTPVGIISESQTTTGSKFIHHQNNTPAKQGPIQPHMGSLLSIKQGPIQPHMGSLLSIKQGPIQPHMGSLLSIKQGPIQPHMGSLLSIKQGPIQPHMGSLLSIKQGPIQPHMGSLLSIKQGPIQPHMGSLLSIKQGPIQPHMGSLLSIKQGPIQPHMGSLLSIKQGPIQPHMGSLLSIKQGPIQPHMGSLLSIKQGPIQPHMGSLLSIKQGPIQPHMGSLLSIKQGPIQPHMGSLLSIKLQHSHCRVPLQAVVAHRAPGRYSLDQLFSLGVHPAVSRVSVYNAKEFSFTVAQYFSTSVLDGAPVCIGDGAVLRLKDGRAGVDELGEAFLSSPGVDRELVSIEWFVNHYK